MPDLIMTEKKAGIATVYLNRPDSLNALSSALMHALTRTFNTLQKDSSIAAVILTGNGRAFCAGLDLEELSADGGLENFSLDGDHDIQAAILGFDRPIIGAINGVAATGGFELALWCDLLIASGNARFIDTHARVGLVPGWGLSQRLGRLIGINRARELSLTGNPLSAEQAERWGLVNRVVAATELLSTCEALAQDMASCHRDTLVRYKRVINEGYGMDLNGALKHERFAMDMHSLTQQGNAIATRKENLKNRNRS